MRQLKGNVGRAVIIIGVIASAFHFYTAGFGLLEPRLQRALHLALMLPLVFLLYPASNRSPKDRVTWSDLLLAVAAFLPSLFMILDRARIEQRWEHVTRVLTIEVVLGTMLLLVILEACRRAVSPVLSGLVLASVAYAFAGPYLPAMFSHSGFKYDRFIELIYLLADEGMYGSLTGVSATYVYLFVLFGSVITVTGVGQFFTNLAAGVAGRVRGGPAQIAVVSSGLFGTMTGVSTANVYATGTFTIPMMKRLGYKPEFAGGVEAAASTGGQYMPPIMGAAAFVMAEMTGIPYVNIALGAAISAILYYLAIFSMVYFKAVRDGLASIPEEERPPARLILRQAHLAVPVVAVFYMLLKGYTPLMAAFVCILVSFAVSFFTKESRITLPRLIEAFVDGAKNTAMIAAALAAASIIVAVITHTGLGLRFTSIVMSLSGGHLVPALLLVMVSALVLGIGMPSTAAYVLTATVGAGALQRMGVDLLAAHLFVYYYAIIACVTPPVSICAFAAASIARSDPIKTGFESFKLAMAGFLVPFTFAVKPALVLRGPASDIFVGVLIALAGVVVMAGGLQGWLLRKVDGWERYMLMVAGIGLVLPSGRLDLMGLVLVVIFLIRTLALRSREAAAAG